MPSKRATDEPLPSWMEITVMSFQMGICKVFLYNEDIIPKILIEKDLLHLM